MLNQIVLVGRLTKDIEVKTGESGMKYSDISIAVPRSFKNADGVYDTDFITFRAFDMVAANTSEYCKKGDIIGVKGRLQSSSFEREDGTKEFRIEPIAEKVTFLSSRSNETKNKDDVERD